MRGIVRALMFACVLVLSHVCALVQPNTVSFQGEVSSGGVLYDGPAVFKFVLLCGTVSVWSNDGSSTNGSEPGVPVGVEVAGGIFSVLLGDAAAGMLPISADALTG